jgi:hypothetical protein
MNKEHILNEIKRTAAANGGVALGTARFYQETGIDESDWGKFWVRWGDAITEAGFTRNQMQSAYSDDFLIDKFIQLIRELGHFPVVREAKLEARHDNNFPSANIFFGRFGGSKKQLARKILDYCKGRPGYEDINAFCEPLAAEQLSEPDDQPAHDIASQVKPGYVYMGLLKIGREKRYKIGKAVLVERRRDQIAIQLPEELELVHSISTDDAYGIEEYWHHRFAAKTHERRMVFFGS